MFSIFVHLFMDFIGMWKDNVNLFQRAIFFLEQSCWECGVPHFSVKVFNMSPKKIGKPARTCKTCYWSEWGVEKKTLWCYRWLQEAKENCLEYQRELGSDDE